MGVQERRERERQETRGRIMAAAREMFAREGYEAVSMRRIADAIEYSPTAIYVHFKDKEDLIWQLCEEDFASLAVTLVKESAAIADPVERVRKGARSYLRFALEHPNHYRLMFMTPLVLKSGEKAFGRKNTPAELCYQFLRGGVAEAIEMGLLRPELREPDLVAQTVWAGIHGLTSLEITKAKESWVNWGSFAKRADMMVDVLVRGTMREKSVKATAPKARRA